MIPIQPMTATDCAAALGVSRETQDRLRVYVEVLLHWQRRRNLIGRGTIADIWRRHILDSGQIAAHIPPEARRITDLGTGAGLPGLVLAIITGLETDLVEADSAKAAFLAEAIRLTNAPGVIHHARIEAVEPWPTDILTARALAPLATLLGYVEPFFRASASHKTVGIFPKGAKWHHELTDSTKTWHMSAYQAPSATDPDARILIVTDIGQRRGPASQR